MHLAAVTGLFSIPPLAFMLTPTGRSMVATAWAWLKGVFGKIAASSPRGILFVIRKKSRSGDEFDVFFSTHDAETVARAPPGFSHVAPQTAARGTGGRMPDTSSRAS